MSSEQSAPPTLAAEEQAAVALEQCSIFVDSSPLRRSMTEGAKKIRTLAARAHEAEAEKAMAWSAANQMTALRDAALASLEAERAAGARMRDALERARRQLNTADGYARETRKHPRVPETWEIQNALLRDVIDDALAPTAAGPERSFQPCKPGEECSDEGGPHCRCARFERSA